MTKVITGKVRFSYLNWAQSKVNELSGKSEFSTQVLIPKSDKATLKALRDAIKEAQVKKWGDKLPANVRNPLRDGDTETKEDGSPLSAEYHGHFWVNIKSDARPGAVDAQLQAIIDPNDFRSGDYGRVSINASAYDIKGNKGVSFWWNNAQMLERGDALGGRARAEDEFESAPRATANANSNDDLDDGNDY